jgi:hypothetical protein
VECDPESIFKGADELKRQVMGIVFDGNGVKEDIESLRQSISHLSSVIIESAKISIVKGASIVSQNEMKNAKNEENKSFSEEEYFSLPISSECSHNEIVIRNNICKLKRDISRKIMNNKHLFKIVNHYPKKPEQNLDDAFRISIREGESASSSVISALLNNKILSSIEDLSSNTDVLNRIESNISSWIPSCERSSVLDENK